MRQITIKQITTAGIFLALLTLLKYFDLFMFKINGYSAIEVYWVVGALSMIVLNWSSSFLILLIAPFLWMAMGQVEFSSPWGIILDYFLPFMALILIKFSKNKYFNILLTLIAALVKLSSHTLSGVLFYDVNFVTSLEINAPFVFITLSISLVLVFLLHSRLRMIAKLNGDYSTSEVIYYLTSKKPSNIKLVRFGYLNKVYSFYFEDKKYILRLPRFARADWNNESLVYKKIFKDDCWIDNSRGYLIKPFIEGSEVEEWNKELLKDLDKKIQEFHSLKINGIKKHDWNEWNKYSNKLDKVTFDKFISLVKKYENQNNVISHNDINRRNVVMRDNQITLIDFEWSRMNHELFDYAQFYVAESIHINDELLNSSEYKDLIFMTLVFSLLWTYSFKINPKVLRLRKKYEKNLFNFNL